ncbi:MAG: hypothetical protein M1360_03525 [Candidatus Marsarchaeota archaeon]|jgi:hypothetical protein|nr:hypothetical protein [Candidatus Marsarchaeota archaeon]MCL5418983.1 hypothetical protein [Candidatus Marsarchaeota archaeon]
MDATKNADRSISIASMIDEVSNERAWAKDNEPLRTVTLLDNVLEHLDNAYKAYASGEHPKRVMETIMAAGELVGVAFILDNEHWKHLYINNDLQDDIINVLRKDEGDYEKFINSIYESAAKLYILLGERKIAHSLLEHFPNYKK